jgi:predicted ABC-type ATPase
MEQAAGGGKSLDIRCREGTGHARCRPLREVSRQLELRPTLRFSPALTSIAWHETLSAMQGHDPTLFLIGGCKSFGLESTLSDKTYAKLLSEAKAAGFFISLHFLVVPSAEVSIERIAHRVTKVGHHVPDADIRRRFTRSVENFLHIFLPLSDEWKVWDNEGNEMKQLATSTNTSHDQIIQLLTAMTLREEPPKPLSPSDLRGLRALQLAYEDAKAENARWGLPMIPQDWTPEDWERARQKHAKKA